MTTFERPPSRKSILFFSILMVSLPFGVRSQIQGSPSLSVCPGGSVVLSYGNPPAGATYQWVRDGADIAGATGATYAASLVGTYNVKLNGVLQTAVTVGTAAKPAVDFGFTPATGCGPTNISFTAQATDGGTPASSVGLAYRWDFGGGASNTTPNPVQSFNPGTGSGSASFSVKLVVTNAAGCRDSLTKPVSLQRLPDASLNGPGFVTFNGEPYFKICTSTGQNFSFTNASSTASTNTRYVFNWGDGTPNTDITVFDNIVTHPYAVGVRTMTYTVFSGSCSSTRNYNIFIGNVPAGGISGTGGSTICTGDAQRFLITGAASNPVGTIYTINYRDGTPARTFSHPPPDTVSHTFQTSSCNASNSNGQQTFLHSFGAYLSIENPCGTAGGSILPIYVSSKPKADFTASRDSICLNQEVTFTNSGLPGNNVESGTCTPGKRAWRVTPLTAGGSWTLQSGSLGNRFGTNDVNLWTQGTHAITIRFNARGLYQVTQFAGNNTLCGLDSVSRVICVNPTPTAAFTLDTDNGCGPLTVNAAGTSNAAECGSMRFAWTATYVPTAGCTPAVSSFDYVNGTGSASQQPRIRFNNPGVYTLRLVTSAPGGACSSTPVERAVTVRGRPSVNVSPLPEACANAVVNPSATTGCGTSGLTYAWTFSGGTPATSATLSPGTVRFSAPGSYPVSLSVTNECGTGTASQTLVVKPVPDVTVPAGQTVCAGSPTGNLAFGSTPSGASFQWTNSSPSIGLPSAGTGSIGSFNPTNATALPIVATLGVTPTLNGCVGTAKSFTLTVNPRPAPPAVASPLNLCQGATEQPLTATVLPGHSLAWYAAATGGAGVATAPTPSTGVPGTVRHYVSQTNGFGCESPRSEIVVNVRPTPSITATVTNPTQCGTANGSIRLSGLTAGTTYAVAYTRDGVAVGPVNLTAVAGGTLTLSGLRSGVYDQLRVTLNGCPSNVLGPLTLSDPSAPPAPVATSTGPLCSGGTLTLSVASPVAGTAYTWSGPAGFNRTGATVTLTNVPVGAAGIYSVTATVSGCTSPAGATTVTVHPTPPAPVVTSPVVYCQAGAAVPLQATAAAGNELRWYTVATGGTASTSTPVPGTSVAGTTVWHVSQVTSSLCEGPRSLIQVTVHPVPVISATASDPTACATANGSIRITGAAPSATYLVAYARNGTPVTLTRTADVAGVVLIPSLSAGTYSAVRLIANGCPSNVLGPFTLTEPAAPSTPVIGPVAALCSGGTLTLSVTSPQAGVTYRWTGPSGFGPTGASVTVNNVPTTAGGTYSVTASLSGCTSPAATVAVTVNPTPAAPAVTSPVTYCQGAASQPLSATSTGGNTLLWYLTATGGTGTATVPVPSTASPGTAFWHVSQLSPEGCEGPRSALQVVVRPVYVIGITSANPTLCAASNGSIRITGAAPNTAFRVEYEKDGLPVVIASLASDAGGVLTLANLSAGVFARIRILLNGCPSNEAGPVTLSDPSSPATPVATNTGASCVGGDITLGVTQPLAGGTYTWTGPNGFSRTSATGSVTINGVGLSGAGAYSVTVRRDGCTSAAGSTQVVVHPLPPAPSVTTPVVYCQNTAALPLEAVATAAHRLLWYMVPTGGTGSATAPVPVTSATGTFNAYVSQVSPDGCEGPRALLQVTVAPTPAIGPQSLTVCSGADFTLTPAGAAAGTRYDWGLPSVTGGLTGGSAGTGTAFGGRLSHGGDLPERADYIVTPRLATCSGSPFAVQVTVDPVPRVSDTVLATCSEERLLFRPDAAAPGNILPADTRFRWGAPTVDPPGSLAGATPGAGVTAVDQQLQNLTSQTAKATYTLTPSLGPSGRCPGLPFTLQVQVRPRPRIPDQQVVICSGGSFAVGIADNPPAVILPAGTLFTWSDPVSVPAGAITGGAAASTPLSAIGQRLVNTTVSTATLTYMVTPLTGGCTGESFRVTVTVHPQPSIPDQAAEVCSGAGFNVTPTGVPAGTRYTWAAPVITPAGALTGGAAQATGQAAIGQTLQNNTNEPAVARYRVSPLAGSCGNAAFEVAVTVFPKPVIPDLTDTICTGLPFSVSPAHQPPGLRVPAATTYTWLAPVSLPAGAVSGGAAEGQPRTAVSQSLQNLSDAPADLVYTVLPRSGAPGGCIGTPFRLTVHVRPDARALFTPRDTVGCPPFALTADVVGLRDFPRRNGGLRWYANDSLLGANIPFPVYTLARENDSVRLRMVALSPYGCRPDSLTRVFRTPILPKPAFLLSDTSGCGPLTVRLTNTTPDGNLFTYRWDFGNGQLSNQPDPGLVTFPVHPGSTDTVYRVTLSVATACADVSFRRGVLVRSKPKAVFAPSRTVGCSPMTVVFQNRSRGRADAYTWLFDDGTVVNTDRRDSMVHVFNTGVQRTFRVRLLARNECGADTSSFDVLVSPNAVRLDMAVNGPEKEGCAPHTVRFINLSTGANAFRWDFGDGNYANTTRNLDTVVHTYPYPGVYIARITGTNGCSDTSTQEAVTVRAAPRALFDLGSIVSCVGDSIRLTNRTDSAGSFVWDFGDGKSSVQVSPAHRYDQPGSYAIRLMAYRVYPSGRSCTDTFTRRVDVVGSRPVSYRADDSIGTCLPFTVRFRTPVAGAQLTTWDFGDGSTATGDSVVHTYTSEGQFQVRMRSISPGGCVYLAAGRVRVTAPSGSYAVDVSNSCRTQTVRIDVTAQGADSVIYDMGNGARFLRSATTFTYTYPNPGRYLPKVILLTAAGCRLPLPNVDTIVVDRIVTGFIWSEARSCGRTELLLTDTSRAFSGIAAAEWTAGPYPGLSGRTVRVSFDASGDYLVQLRVRAQGGCQDSVRRTLSLRVNSRPTAGILADTVGCTGREVRFEPVVQSADRIVQQAWLLPNGSTSGLPALSLRLTQPGGYAVRLVVGTEQGCYDTAVHRLVVHPTPSVRAGDDLRICAGQSVRLRAAGADSYAWSPQQGLSCTDCPDPLASPDATVDYVVRGSTAQGCRASDTVRVWVIPRMRMAATGSDSICLGDSVRLFATGAVSWEWSPATGLSATDVPSPLARPTLTTRYRVVGRDGHNCFSDTAYLLVAVGQPVRVDLGPDVTLPTGTQLPLRSTITNGPVRTWAWSPSKNLSCTGCALPVATVRQHVTYQVRVTSIYGCQATDSIRITAFCETAQVFIPNAFSPDGDGVNDVLMVRAQGIGSVRHFRIFNRWGEVVFERNNFPPNDPAHAWNGQVRGKPAWPDVFVYTAEVVCDDGTTYTYKGNITLIK